MRLPVADLMRHDSSAANALVAPRPMKEAAQRTENLDRLIQERLWD